MLLLYKRKWLQGGFFQKRNRKVHQGALYITIGSIVQTKYSISQSIIDTILSMIQLTHIVKYYKYSRKRQQVSNKICHNILIFSKKGNMVLTMQSISQSLDITFFSMISLMTYAVNCYNFYPERPRFSSQAVHLSNCQWLLVSCKKTINFKSSSSYLNL